MYGVDEKGQVVGKFRGTITLEGAPSREPAARALREKAERAVRHLADPGARVRQLSVAPVFDRAGELRGYSFALDFEEMASAHGPAAA